LNHRIYSSRLQPLIPPQYKLEAKSKKENTTFQELLHSELQTVSSLKLSKHAEQRMSERGISINEKTWQQIEGKLSEAREKGIKDSLVLLEQAALVVNAKTNTVITAMNREEASSHIFTNINGTILID